jgi:hypothetical protein
MRGGGLGGGGAEVQCEENKDRIPNPQSSPRTKSGLPDLVIKVAAEVG